MKNRILRTIKTTKKLQIILKTLKIKSNKKRPNSMKNLILFKKIKYLKISKCTAKARSIHLQTAPKPNLPKRNSLLSIIKRKLFHLIEKNPKDSIPCRKINKKFSLSKSNFLNQGDAKKSIFKTCHYLFPRN